MLSLEQFKHVVTHTPLFAIDLVVLNDQQQILLGKRNNAPAKGFWFVPGGRVYKNESLPQAFARISQAELGQAVDYRQAVLLGLFDHFYDDSIFGNDISTHYINAAHLIKIPPLSHLELPKLQHDDYRWVRVGDLEGDTSVHQYSKVFLGVLKDYLQDQIGL